MSDPLSDPGSQDSSEFSGHTTTSGTVATCEEATPPRDPCYLYKMVIREEWPDAKPPPEKETADLAELDEEIKDKQLDLFEVRLRIDEVLLEDDDDWEDKLETLKKERNDLQSEILDLIVKGSNAASPKVEPPPKDVREFTILNELPEDQQAQIDQAKETLDGLRAELKQILAEGHSAHEAHERAKKELLEFDKKLEEVRAEKDKHRVALEGARRHRDEAKENLEAYENKTHSTGRWKTAKRRAAKAVGKDAKSKSKKADKAYEKVKAAFEEAKGEFEELASDGYEELKDDVKEKREATYQNIKDVRSKIEEIEEEEKTHLELRNTLPSGWNDPIKMVGGAGGKWWTPWNLDQMQTEKSIEKGKLVTKKSSDDESTPTVTVNVDTDGKPDAPAEGYQSYCGKRFPLPAPWSEEPPVKHPVLTVKESQSELEEGTVTATSEGEELKFKVWQFRQFDEGTEKVEWVKAVGARLSLMVVKTFFRILQWATSGHPKKRRYLLEARACGYFDVDPNSEREARATRLKKTIEVYPADSWEIVLSASAFASTGFEYEQKVQDTTRPASETGQLAVEDAGMADERTVSETFTESSVWGTQSTTTTRSEIWGSDEDGGKHVVVEDTTTRNGSQVERTMQADGTLHGEEYSGTLEQSAEIDFSGNVTSGSRSLDDSAKESAPQLSRAPAMPGSFFPMCPVDVSFKRNGAEDEVTQNIKNCVGTIIFLVRKTADCVSRVANIVPSFGWKFGFQVDFLSGSLSYYNQFREHIDRHVYMYRKGMLDVRIVTAKVFIFGGFWVEFIVGEIKFGAEININGNVGIKGLIENTHPDAENNVNVGFGPTGGIGCGAELMLIVGSPDWCRAATGVTSSISAEGMWWLKHTDGPFLEYDFKFDGVKLNVTANLILVGSYQKIWHLANASSLKQGRFPEAFDEKDLLAQSAEMDRHAREEAKKAEKAEEKRRKKEEKERKAEEKQAKLEEARRKKQQKLGKKKS